MEHSFDPKSLTEICELSKNLEKTIKEYDSLRKKFIFDLTGEMPREAVILYSALLLDEEERPDTDQIAELISAMRERGAGLLTEFHPVDVAEENRPKFSLENISKDRRCLALRKAYQDAHVAFSKAEHILASVSLTAPITEDGKTFLDLDATSVHDAVLSILDNIDGSVGMITEEMDKGNESWFLQYMEEIPFKMVASNLKETMKPLIATISAALRCERLRIVEKFGLGFTEHDKRNGFHSLKPVYIHEGKEIDFSKTQWNLIQSARVSGNCISIKDLGRIVWRDETVTQKRIKNHVDQIRKKMVDTPLRFVLTEEYFSIE